MTGFLRAAVPVLGLVILAGFGLRESPGRGAPLRNVVEADTTRPKQVYVNADSLIKLVENGISVRRLIGNVLVRQDSTWLWAREAVEYIERESFLFTGDVLIVERGDSLRADTVLYDKRAKTGRARGDVHLTDGEVVVRAPSGVYFTEEKRARFEEGVTLVDSLSELESRRGTYWSDEKRAELEGAVRLRAEDSYLEADSLTYYRETEVSVARGDVFIERLGADDTARSDSSVRTLLFGQYAYHDEQGARSLLEGDPLLVQLREDSTGSPADTLLIRAARLEAVERDSLRRLVAVGTVRIWQPTFAAVADSVVYERLGLDADTSENAGRLEETRLYRDPVIWVEDTQINGDTVRVKGEGGDVDSLIVRGDVFVAQRDTVIDRIQQVKGRHLAGVFQEDSVRVFRIGPNAEAIYFRRGAADQLEGGLQARGDVAVFRFRGEEPEQIVFTGEPEGVYYPRELLPEPFQLDGLRWVPERRPVKDDLIRREQVLARLRRPSVGPASEGMPADEQAELRVFRDERERP